MLKIIPAIACTLALSSCASLQQNPTALNKQKVIAQTSYNTYANKGLITLPSPYSVKQTADRFESIAEEKGLTVFARIDHQKNALGAGLSLPPTEVILFGNPKAGTPLMNCTPSVAIDLPQKVLISEDAAGKVQLIYNDPEYLRARHKVTGCDKVINNISLLLSSSALETIAN